MSSLWRSSGSISSSPPLSGLFGKCDKGYVRPLLPLSLSSHSVVSDSLWPHGLQHSRLPCPSLSPGVCSDSCPLIRWCHLTISSSVTPFSSCSHLSQHQDLFQGVGLSMGRYKKAAEPKSWCSEKSHDSQSCLHPTLFCFLLLLTSRGMVPTHHTSPDGHRRYPYPERNALMPSVLGKILCTCIIPLLRRYILIIDNKEIQKNDKEKNQINYITFWCISLWYALKSFCCYCWFADV